MDRSVFIVLEAVLLIGLLLFLYALRRNRGVSRDGRALALVECDFNDDEDDAAQRATPVEALGAPLAGLPEQDIYPSSAEKALAEDRFETADRRCLIGFRDAEGVEKYAVASNVLRRGNALNVCCHLSGGGRRVFGMDRIVGIYDASSREAIPIDRFILHRPGRA